MPLGDLMAALISKGQGRWPLAYLPWPHFIWQDMVADQLEINLPNRIDQRKGEDNMATARTKRKQLFLGIHKLDERASKGTPV